MCRISSNFEGIELCFLSQHPSLEKRLHSIDQRSMSVKVPYMRSFYGTFPLHGREMRYTLATIRTPPTMVQTVRCSWSRTTAKNVPHQRLEKQDRRCLRPLDLGESLKPREIGQDGGHHGQPSQGEPRGEVEWMPS